MSGLRLASNLLLPVEAATETFAILGKRGSGKTSTAVVMVEEMVDAGQPVVVLDPVGVWWGLRSSASGTWSTYLSELRRADLVEQDSAGWTLTDAGFDYIGGRPSPMTGAELQAHYRSILRSGAVKMLDALIDEYPDGLTRDQLGERAGIATTGGTFSTYLSELVRNQLAVRDGDVLTATDILMHGAEYAR